MATCVAPTHPRRSPGVLSILVVAAVALAGCAALPSTTDPAEEASGSPSPTPSASPTPASSAPPIATTSTYTDVPPPNDRPQPTPPAPSNPTTSSTTSTSSSATTGSATNTGTTTNTGSNTSTTTTATPTPAAPRGIEVLDDGQPIIGAWVGGWPNAQNGAIAEFEENVGQPLDVVDVYLDWFTPVANVTSTMEHIIDAGATPSLTWEAQTITTPQIVNGSRELGLRDGRHVAINDYLAEFAQGVCDVAQDEGEVVLIRVLHEMNGGWFAWGISFQTGAGDRPNTPETFKQAWIKVHDAFDDRCGDAVRFVWAVNHASVGEGADFTNAFPGAEYVDYVAIDGYNWGSDAWWGWQDFDTLFRPAYCAVTALTDKPLFLAETASSENGGDKAAWIADLFASRERFPRIDGVVWLNDHKFEAETDGPMDWRVESSDESLAAFAAGADAWHALRSGGDEPADAEPC